MASAPTSVARISVSMPEDLLSELDDMVAARGFESRRQTRQPSKAANSAA